MVVYTIHIVLNCTKLIIHLISAYLCYGLAGVYIRNKPFGVGVFIVVYKKHVATIKDKENIPMISMIRASYRICMTRVSHSTLSSKMVDPAGLNIQ